MNKIWRKVLAAIPLVIACGLALGAGFLTNGLPIVYPAGTTASQSGIGTAYTVLPLTGNELIPADTQLSGGAVPQSEAVSVNQLGLYTPAVSALTDATTVAVDASLGSVYTLTLGGNRVIANPSNLVTGKQWTMIVRQDSTGSRAPTWGTLYSWPNTTSGGYSGAGTAPTLVTSANAYNLIRFIYNGTSILASVVKD